MCNQLGAQVDKLYTLHHCSTDHRPLTTNNMSGHVSMMNDVLISQRECAPAIITLASSLTASPTRDPAVDSASHRLTSPGSKERVLGTCERTFPHNTACDDPSEHPCTFGWVDTRA